MFLIWLGLLIFTFAHLLNTSVPGIKKACIARAHPLTFRGGFSLLVLTGLLVIVAGWRSTLPTSIYLPPQELRPAGIAIITLGFVGIAASFLPSRIKVLLRHPQLTGLLLWAIGHLMINGDQRSLSVFGALAVWSILQIVAINRRDGEWVKKQAPSAVAELAVIALAAALIAAAIWLHPWISGRAVF